MYQKFSVSIVIQTNKLLIKSKLKQINIINIRALASLNKLSLLKYSVCNNSIILKAPN